MFKDTERDVKNNNAFLNPQPGDYWHEMFCPYFIVVNVKGDKYTVLSCLGGPDSYSRKDEPNARIDNKDGTWSFDYSKSMVVDREWLERTVKYRSISGFVADVVNSEKTQSIVREWRSYVQKEMKARILQLESEWEEFTGWKYLKEDTQVT